MMISLKEHFQTYGASSLRDLASRLETQNLHATRIAKVAAIHSVFNAEGGPLSFGPPVSSVVFGEGTAERSYFKGGKITLLDSGEAHIQRPRSLRIDFVGFRCDRESDELSSQDEVKFVISCDKSKNVIAVGPISVDAEQQYTDGQINAWISTDEEVSPRDVQITVAVTEEDWGNSDAAKQRVSETAADIFEKTNALYMGATGGDQVKTAEIEKLKEFVTTTASRFSGLIVGALGLADDDVGQRSVMLFPGQEPTTATTPPDQGDCRGTTYNYNIPTVGEENDHQGVHTFYFNVRVQEVPVTVR